MIEPQKIESLLTERYDDGRIAIDFRLARHGGAIRGVVRVSGHGTMEGAHALVAFLDKAIAAAGDGRASAMMMLEVQSTPIRAQFLLGKWLIKYKSRVGAVSVVGARAWERKLATAVCAMAGFDNLAFHVTEAESRTWLGWTDGA